MAFASLLLPGWPIWLDLGVLVAAGLLVVLLWLIRANRVPAALPCERVFLDPRQGLRECPFPSVFDEPSAAAPGVTLSLIVPAYNEERRMDSMCEETLAYLKRKQAADKSFTWEMIVVDDGSKDQTKAHALKYCEMYGTDRIRLLQLGVNQGKGAAVRKGMLRARGRYALMVDADGASRIDDLDMLFEHMKRIEKDGLGIAIGSRAHMEAAVVVERKFLRNLAMWAFHFLVHILGQVYDVRDTQCGFKLFSRRAIQRTFALAHINRWAFDVEILYLAERQRIPIAEVPINWHEVDGSKLSLMSAGVNVLKDLFRMRASLMLGLWRNPKPVAASP